MILFISQLGNYYERIGEENKAYEYFRKLYDLLIEIYGPNYPKTNRVIGKLNEFTFRRIAGRLGHQVPSKDVKKSEKTSDNEDDDEGPTSNKITFGVESDESESDDSIN